MKVIAAAALALLLSACGGQVEGGQGEEPRTITVLAAASLTDAFTTLGEQFEQANPGTTVTFSFGPSSGLAAQIEAGAPADVFAAASPAAMTQVGDAAVDPEVFATNTMQIVVPPDNPAGIDSLHDLADPDVKVVLCADTVPCGAAAKRVLANANLTLEPASYEVDVKATLTKVVLGEADAGIVYVTDAKAAGATARSITIPTAVNARTDYPISTLTSTSDLAQAFVDSVTAPAGQEALRRAGFGAPAS